MAEKARIPAVEGWFVDDGGPGGAPALVGARGKTSGSYFFPTALAVSGNPHAPGEEREAVLLSRTGRVWSWTTNHYAPPEPYVAPDPFVPYTVVAVELDVEKMVVLGLLADGVDPAMLEVGTPVTLEIGPLYEDDEHTYTVWKWRPAA